MRISHEGGKEVIVTTTNGTYLWSLSHSYSILVSIMRIRINKYFYRK